METVSFADKIARAMKSFQERGPIPVKSSTMSAKNITAVSDCIRNFINTNDIGKIILDEISETGASHCEIMDLGLNSYRPKGSMVFRPAPWYHAIMTDTAYAISDSMKDIEALLQQKLDFKNISIKVCVKDIVTISITLDWEQNETVSRLEKEIESLKNELYYRPDGEGAMKAQEDFKSLLLINH